MTFTDYDYLQKMKKSMLNALEHKGLIKDKNNDKYIIKNCEQIHSADNFCWSKNALCQDCTDCVMKRIVEKCFNSKFFLLHYNHPENNGFKNLKLALEILNILDIQEVK